MNDIAGSDKIYQVYSEEDDKYQMTFLIVSME